MKIKRRCCHATFLQPQTLSPSTTHSLFSLFLSPSLSHLLNLITATIIIMIFSNLYNLQSLKTSPLNQMS